MIVTRLIFLVKATALLTAVGEDPVTRVEVEKVLTRLAREAAEAAAAEAQLSRGQEGLIF